jgi:hypothetical protein
MRAFVAVRLGISVLALMTGLGCLSGAIYSHVTVPLDVNLDRTAVHEGEERYFTETKNTFDYYIRVDWGSSAIGDIARKHGFSRVDYADLEILTVLGVWSQERVHLYGVKASP